MVAGALIHAGAWSERPKRRKSVGTIVKPRFPVGETMGPTLSWLSESYCGSSGELMSRLSADTTLIKSASGSSISQAVRNTIMLTGAMTMMFITSERLSMIVLAVIPLIVLPLIGYGRVVRRLSRVAQDELADASAYAAENLGAVRTMQAFGHEQHVVTRFANAVERVQPPPLAILPAAIGIG